MLSEILVAVCNNMLKILTDVLSQTKNLVGSDSSSEVLALPVSFLEFKSWRACHAAIKCLLYRPQISFDGRLAWASNCNVSGKTESNLISRKRGWQLPQAYKSALPALQPCPLSIITSPTSVFMKHKTGICHILESEAIVKI